ncbi:MAG: hypothetical protein B1H11_01980 [Desulfobacteraceae bacterium 4484_190.1]|nr:MAG: hypothetical protein B1H11_01980 [Desulfobacteraceae bacterium 4484_190.1]
MINFKLNNLTMVLILSLFIIFLPVSSAVAVDKSPYKIGVNLELTGPWANPARTLKMAMEMEVERINKMGGINGHPMELVIKDNGFDITRISFNMLKFARDNKILAVVGPFEDNFQATARAIAEREGITNIIVCPSNPGLRALKQRWSFNIAQNDIVVTRKVVDLCLARGYRKVLVFAGNWPLAQSLAHDFRDIAEKTGIKAIVSNETHSPADIDMTPQLIKLMPLIKTEGADALYAVTGGPPAPVICRNMRNLGIKIPVIGTHAFGFGFIIDLGGDAMEGVEFPAGKPVVPFQLNEDDPVRPVITAFQERMMSRFGVGADQISGHGYDIIWLLYDAFNRCRGNVTRLRLRDSLEKTKGFKGCTGVFNFSPADHDGLGKNDMVFVRIENHKFVRVRFAGFEE